MLPKSIPIAALGWRNKLQAVILAKPVKAAKKLRSASTVDSLHLLHGLMRGIYDGVVFAVKEHQGAVTHSINAHEDKASAIVVEREVHLAMSKRNAEVAIKLSQEHVPGSQRVTNRDACYWIHEFR